MSGMFDMIEVGDMAGKACDADRSCLLFVEVQVVNEVSARYSKLCLRLCLECHSVTLPYCRWFLVST